MLCVERVGAKIATWCGIGFCFVFVSVGQAALVLDFATNTDASGAPDVVSGVIENALFEWGTSPGGTGLIQSIVRIGAQGPAAAQQGYNTSGRPVPYAEMNTSPSFTRDAQLGAVPVINENGTDYYEFLFDLNQNNGAGSKLSIDDIQVYTSPTNSNMSTTLGSLGALRYHLDATMDSEILLDHANAPGGGTVDMRMLLPTSNFLGAATTDFVYLYSHMGGKGAGWLGTAGPEEWAFKGQSVTVAVPEPSQFLLFGLIAAIFGVARRRK